MKTSICARHMPLTATLERYAEAKLSQGVERVAGDPALRLEIELSQMTHARDGRTARCRALVSLPRGRRVVVWLRDDDMYKAIDRVHDRLLNAVTRQLCRHRQVAMARRPTWRRRAGREAARVS